jgi:hypothetical protein
LCGYHVAIGSKGLCCAVGRPICGCVVWCVCTMASCTFPDPQTPACRCSEAQCEAWVCNVTLGESLLLLDLYHIIQRLYRKALAHVYCCPVGACR